MPFFRYFAVLCVLLLPAAYSRGQISIGIGVGAPAYAPPECTYGYFGYPPYGCAPYGYYGPQWFQGGVFIGAGPWYRAGYGYGRGWYGGRDGEGWRGNDGLGERGDWWRGRGDFARNRVGYGGDFRRGGVFRGTGGRGDYHGRGQRERGPR